MQNQASAQRAAGLSYWRGGSGPTLLFLHGWPFHSHTFRKIIPLLSERFTCIAVDSAGMGESRYRNGLDSSFTAHARRLLAFVTELGLERFSIVGHDTGGTIARLLAAEHPQLVERLVLMDTETPGRLPEIVPRYQRMLRNGVARWLFRQALRSKRFARSPHGFQSCFHDRSKLDDEFIDLFCVYWTRTRQRFDGMLSYLMAIDGALVQRLSAINASIRAPTLLLWGEYDRIFPLGLARTMARDMPACVGLSVIRDAGFLPQEEQPDAVADEIARFLEAAQSSSGQGPRKLPEISQTPTRAQSADRSRMLL